MVPNERSSAFLMVTCSCGRGLRAKLEQAGAEIRCWDCQKFVKVPIPNAGQRVARELSDGAMIVIKGPDLHLILALGAVVTAALAIPHYGVWCSVVVLMLGASAYGEIIRRVSLGLEGAGRVRWMGSLAPRSPLKFVLCSLLATGTVVPLWWLNAGLMRSPHFDGLGRAILASTWIIVPLLMLMVYGRTEQDSPLGIRESMKLLIGHPIAILVALGVIPLTLMLVEFAIAFMFYVPGNLSFFALDFMPMPVINHEKATMFNGIPHYHRIDYRGWPLSTYEKSYLDGLRHGYSFVGGIPASLSMPTRAGMDGNEVLGMFDPFYLLFRIFLVIVIVSSLLAAFAVQARWLGSIPLLVRRRLA